MKVGMDKYVIEGAYGPGSGNKKDKCENFWSDLGEVVWSFERDEIVCMFGDLNARVGDHKVQGVNPKSFHITLLKVNLRSD